MPELSVYGTTIRICCSRNLQTLFLGGVLFLLINMLFQSLRLPFSKHLYSVQSKHEPDHQSQFLSNSANDNTMIGKNSSVPGTRSILHHQLRHRMQPLRKNIPLTGRETVDKISRRTKLIGEDRNGLDNNHVPSSLSNIILDSDSPAESEIKPDSSNGVSVTGMQEVAEKPAEAVISRTSRGNTDLQERTGERVMHTDRSLGANNTDLQEEKGERVEQSPLSSNRQQLKPRAIEEAPLKAENQSTGKAGLQLGAQARTGRRMIHAPRINLGRDSVSVQEGTKKRVKAQRASEKTSQKLHFIQRPGARAGDGYWIPSAFKPRLEGRNLEILKDIVATFVEAMRQAGVQFFLYSGSLLGSWRHHGLVPWDDDVDFVAASRDQQKVYRALRDQQPHYMLNVWQKVRWKFFSSRSHPIQGITWSWPFLDISFYLENDTHIWDKDSVFPAFCYPKDVVFPLQDRPFMGHMLPAPKNTEAVLRHNYNLSLCKLGVYDHQKESVMEAQRLGSVSCSRLVRVFPFVQRVSVPGLEGCNETLVLFGQVISWVFLPQVDC